MSRRAFYAVALLVSLLLAGVVSSYASSHPDGLEHVAAQTGFLGSAEDSPTADSPLADYSTRGVDDERAGTGIAGVVGALATLLLMGGLTLAVRRRRGASGSDPARP